MYQLYMRAIEVRDVVLTSLQILELEDFASADGDASKSAPVGVGKVASSALTHGSEVSDAFGTWYAFEDRCDASDCVSCAC